ncbi:hypothetical protein P153DRAFT_366086 [Dothidotthia symphoricarpi CBS 119687]|uniref:Uncharacterized protein n=1 Tax=Dothidotthia symphoricarpi CBS 119687 TaxID=1392245 RepID=A0A6A6AI05_9PLEO|nr:uncharacterized protein P153DRAFT_366086 [Dothidotthia symphoricarpi CBS 119687]KAF2130504.1 hypothetical protein P153DRAFT_366086 [Dothidotthia symphoricarpi CBS 119687]
MPRFDEYEADLTCMVETDSQGYCRECYGSTDLISQCQVYVTLVCVSMRFESSAVPRLCLCFVQSRGFER